MEKKFSLPEYGLEVVLGKFAGQADGAAWLQQSGTVVLSVVASAPSKDFPGFLPLSVDYREHFSAAGKIPGGYFKREGRMSDKEVLTSRLVDRAIRPLFPENYFDQVQVTSTVYSVDKSHMPHTLSLLATSIALVTSKIPFIEPVGVAEIVRCNGEWIVNPTYQQSLQSDVKITVAGTQEGICMVEGSASEISEKEFVDLLFKAHAVIEKQVAWQREIQAALAVEKNPIKEHFDMELWKKRASDVLTDELVKTMFTQDKVERGEVQSNLKKLFFDTYAQQIIDEAVTATFLEYMFDAVLRDKIVDLCFVQNKRVDTRDFDQVRQISTEVGLLPFSHGSALFTRGRTQALVSVTLGGGQDEARSDNLMGDPIENAFMLHYNFPSFSVGEVRPNRGPGRREVGHGYLAASAIEKVLPERESFPYTIRIVADMLESDGSTSQATICGSTMALMNAGVPIKKMVSGVAMGLLRSSRTGEFRVLTDIAGIEDAYGLMDFKVAGTDDGITAIQMDIKYKGGLPREVFDMALEKAKNGRFHIMGEMRKVMNKPAEKLSELVPQIISFKVPTEKIGAIIGSGGKVIREITDKTGCSIDIEDSGLVKILGHPGEKLDQAVAWVKVLGGQIERGMRFQGIIKRTADFGLFVEIAPGLDGLVHISMIPRAEQVSFMKSVNIGDVLPVEVVDYEPETGRIRLKIS